LKVRITTTLASNRKDQECGAEQPVCPDESQKILPDLGKSLQAPPLHLYPKIPRIPAEKPHKQTQNLVQKIP
jgi:hypothetical protein